MRNRLLRAYRYAFRKNPELPGRVAEITKGDGDGDIIQDLNDLVVLGRNHPEPLKSINLDLSLPDTSATMAVDMAKLNTAANGIEDSEEEAKIMRDKSYVHL